MFDLIFFSSDCIRGGMHKGKWWMSDEGKIVRTRTPFKEEIFYMRCSPIKLRSNCENLQYQYNNVINLFNERVYKKNLKILIIKFKLKTSNDHMCMTSTFYKLKWPIHILAVKPA